MEVIIPENISDITLEQFQKFTILNDREIEDEHEYNKRVVSIFTNIKYNQSDRISKKDFESIILDILNALNKEVSFSNTFKIGDVEYGFIPNFDDITAKEFFDLNLYRIDDIKNYHKLMAILYRPITKKDAFNNYSIEPYNGTDKHSDKMKYAPMNIVNGCLVFFSSLASELSNHTLKYTAVQQARELAQATTSISGSGMQL